MALILTCLDTDLTDGRPGLGVGSSTTCVKEKRCTGRCLCNPMMSLERK